MKLFVRALATALSLEEELARDAVLLILEAVAAGAAPEDWAAVRAAVPEAADCLDPRQRTTPAVVGPPPQAPGDLEGALGGTGLGRWRTLLLMGLTLRYLGLRVGEERVIRIVDRVPALAVADVDLDEVGAADPVAAARGPVLEGDPVPGWLSRIRLEA